MFSLLPLFLCFVLQSAPADSLEEAVSDVQRLLEESSNELDVSRAVIKLAAHDDPKAAKKLAEMLPSFKGWQRYTAVTALEHCKNNSGFAELQRLILKSKFNLDRWAATSVLVKSAEGREWLVKNYSKLRTLEVKVMLVESLGRGKSQDKLLTKLSKDKTPAIQGAALHAAARNGLSKTQKTAWKALDDGHVDVRKGAAYACGYWGGAKGMDKLVKLSIKEKNPDVLSGLWHSLRLADDEEEIEALANATLKARKKQAQVFLAQALVVASHHQPEIAGPAFAKLLKNKDSDIRHLALQGIEATAHQASLPDLIQLLKARDPSTRADAMRALSALQSIPLEHHKTIIELCQDQDVDVRMAATMALTKLPEEAALPIYRKQLKDDSWSIQDFAVSALAQMRSVDSTRILAEHMQSAEGLVREITYNNLRELTGQDFGMASSAWSRWLEEQGEDFELPSPEQAKQLLAAQGATRSPDEERYGVVQYHDINVQSGGIIFIFDRSKSMGEKFSATKEVFLDYFAGELASAIQAMREDQSFNIILFSDEAQAWKPALVKVNRQSKAEAIDFILKQRSGGSTQLDQAIERAFQDQDVQQIYIMTDGDPSGGASMKTQIIDRVADLNRYRRVRIHTIVAGDVHGDFLKELALANGGTSVDLRN